MAYPEDMRKISLVQNYGAVHYSTTLNNLLIRLCRLVGTVFAKSKQVARCVIVVNFSSESGLPGVRKVAGLFLLCRRNESRGLAVR
jgi:hypothetical protein